MYFWSLIKVFSKTYSAILIDILLNIYQRTLYKLFLKLFRANLIKVLGNFYLGIIDSIAAKVASFHLGTFIESLSQISAFK